MRSTFTPVGNFLICAASFAAATFADADDRTRRDPAGTSAIMGQFRSLFARWDKNNDGYLDREELARAFRGPSARPVPFTGSTSSKVARYADYDFLIQLDQNGDGKISRTEFLDWARSIAPQLKRMREGRQSSATGKKLQGQTNAAEKKLLKAEQQQQQASVKEMEKELKLLQTIDKHLQHGKKYGSKP